MTTMNATRLRIGLLAAEAAALEPWLGPVTADNLADWLADELGHPDALDSWVRRGPIHSRAVPLSPLLHIISGNTPHAGFQSLVRGLLLGGRQRVKLPSAGLPALETWIANLPPGLAGMIETSRELPAAWRDSPAAVIFGDAETLRFFRDWLPGDTRRIEYGPKLSAAVVFADLDAGTARALAGDVLRHDQRGCLSVQAVLVHGDTVASREAAARLARALDVARAEFPAPPRSISESGAIRNFREIVRYRAANGQPLELWECRQSTAWTVVHDAGDAPLLSATPGGGTVMVRPFTGDLTAACLGPEAAHLSTVVLHPFDDDAARLRLDALAPPRICAPGMAQFPGVFWSHDGGRPLASLVRWRDIG
jgi:hypothetical protein